MAQDLHPAWHLPREIFRNTVEHLLDTPPEILLDLRFAELEAARVAADQVLVELVANARDAALTHRSPDPPRIVIGLVGASLFVANDGAPFSRDGFAALRRIARSGKRHPAAPPSPGHPETPSEVDRETPSPKRPFSPLTLGRHGVGAKSVLSLSDTPRIYGRSAEGDHFAFAFGEARLGALAEAALGGDADACAAVLSPPEAAWLGELLAEVPLDGRSLPRHGRRARLAPGELAAGLPVMTFPLALFPEDAPETIARLLGWRGSGERPFTTVVEVPLRPGERSRSLDAIEAQIPTAQRCVMGTRIRFSLAGDGQSPCKSGAERGDERR